MSWFQGLSGGKTGHPATFGLEVEAEVGGGREAVAAGLAAGEPAQSIQEAAAKRAEQMRTAGKVGT
jgi:hypothetical protein